MRPLPHHYDVTLSASSTGHAVLRAPGLTPFEIDAPADFDGPGDAWSPEHLLLASVQSCLLLTFRVVAGRSRFPFLALTIDTRGTVDIRDGVLRFTEILLRPRLTVPPGSDLERARRLLELSEKACLVSASLSTPVRLDATVTVASDV